MAFPHGSLACFLVGTGSIIGLIVLGVNIDRPEPHGNCWVESSNSSVVSECLDRGNKAPQHVINLANITLADGTQQSCNTFELSSGCLGGINAGDPRSIINGGGRRPCFRDDSDGACYEPAAWEGPTGAGPMKILCWVVAAGLCPICSLCVIACYPWSEESGKTTSGETPTSV